MINFNGLKIYISKNTRYIPLPREIWREAGQCDCLYCKGKIGYWDTLAVPDTGSITFTVHYPELQMTKYQR